MKNEIEFKNDFGKNLSEIRKGKNITQQKLAEMISYSDKAVSKWERGEAVPDLFTVMNICEVLDVDPDVLCGFETDGKSDNSRIDNEKGEAGKRKVISAFVPAISAVGVWFVCSVLYFVLKNIPVTEHFADLSFYLAVPVTFIVLLVLSFIWWRSIPQLICLSGLIWSVGGFFYAIMNMFLNMNYSSMLFICCGILQLIAVLVYIFVRYLKKAKNR